MPALAASALSVSLSLVSIASIRRSVAKLLVLSPVSEVRDPVLRLPKGVDLYPVAHVVAEELWYLRESEVADIVFLAQREPGDLLGPALVDRHDPGLVHPHEPRVRQQIAEHDVSTSDDERDQDDGYDQRADPSASRTFGKRGEGMNRVVSRVPCRSGVGVGAHRLGRGRWRNFLPLGRGGPPR